MSQSRGPNDPYLADLWSEWKNEHYDMKPWEYMGLSMNDYIYWYYSAVQTSLVMQRQSYEDIPPPSKHNHMTRDIKPYNQCSACDENHIQRARVNGVD